MGGWNTYVITAIVTTIVSFLNVHDNILFFGQIKQHSEHIIADFILALIVGTCESFWVLLKNSALQRK